MTLLKITKMGLIFLFWLIIPCGLYGQTLDSVVYRSDGSTLKKIYKLQSGQEVRFYNANGFLCFAFRKDNAGKVIHCQGKLKKTFEVDIQKDPIFLADTFALGFANRVELLRDSLTISESFNRTIKYYYSHKLCPNDIEIELGKIENFGEENCISNGYIDRPTILESWFSAVKFEVLKTIMFSEEEVKSNDNRLLIFVDLGKAGFEVDLKLLSKLTEENASKINYRLSYLKTLPAIRFPSARYRAGSARGAFYIQMR